jgi:hypothetical protein
MKYSATAASALAAAALLLSSASCREKERAPFGASYPLDFAPADPPSDRVKGCLAKAPKPSCVTSGEDRSAIAKYSNSYGIQSDDTVTYHNDNSGGRDQSVDLYLKKFFLVQPANNPVFQQHTHGLAHTFLVMTRPPGGGTPVVNAYNLDDGDKIRVHYGQVGATMPWQQIVGQSLTPDLLIEKVKLSNASVPSCTHSGGAHQGDFWQYTAPASLAGAKSVSGPIPPAGDYSVYSTTAPTFLRRILITNAAGLPKAYIHLDSGCSAFKICTRVADNECDRVPLCAIDPSELPACPEGSASR